MKLIVTIPAFNEEERIANVIRNIPREIEGCTSVQVLVIDDGSTDATREVARNAGADHVIRHARNSGVVYAFKNGLKKAVELGADIVVNIDADGQFDPLEIPKLVDPIIHNKADVVLGSRFMDSSYPGIPLKKRIGNLIISRIVSIMSAKRIRDTQCGFRALSREASSRTCLSGIFTYTQEMIIDLSFKRMQFLEIPISVRYFEGRKSRVVKNIFKYTFKVLGVLLLSAVRRFKYTLSSFLFLVLIIIILLTTI